MTCKKYQTIGEMSQREIIGSGPVQRRGSKTSRINTKQTADCAASTPGHVQRAHVWWAAKQPGDLPVGGSAAGHTVRRDSAGSSVLFLCRAQRLRLNLSSRVASHLTWQCAAGENRFLLDGRRETTKRAITITAACRFAVAVFFYFLKLAVS